MIQYFIFLPPIYLVMMFFFPKVFLIINSILLTHMLYLWYRLGTGDTFNGNGLYNIVFSILTIFEIILLFIFFSSGRKND